MTKKTSKNTRDELVKILKQRYGRGSKKEKTRILDEFTALTEHHRKHAIRLLGTIDNDEKLNKPIISRRIYKEALKEALVIVWEAADRICSKRLTAIIPDLIASMERHKHLELNAEVRQQLFKISASTIDRVLSEVRKKAQPYKKKRKFSKRVNKEIPIRTFADWNESVPGYLEIDFVAHSGGSMAGKFIHTLVVTDVCLGWIEIIPLLSRDQALVAEGLEALRRQIPFPVLGINSDNDSAFINNTLLDYCKRHNMKFTRSRPFHKNDQAWIEQKNGAVVRRFVGHDRFSGVVASQALAHLYQAIRLYVNYFQPSFKLKEKERQGSKIKKLYYKPATPCNRLLNHPDIKASIKESLQLQRIQLDPVRLLHEIRNSQSALVALASSGDSAAGPGRTSLEQFLAQLPQLWQYGDARPTHQKRTQKIRRWRTRKDPFKNVWVDIILQWLQNEPDITAKELFNRLQEKYPGNFANNQLRTLQRRIREWRQIMAKKLVYSCLDTNIEQGEMLTLNANT